MTIARGVALGLVMGLALVGCKKGKGSGAPARAGAPTASPSTVSAVALADQSGLDPGAVLIARERDVWSLEGRLVGEAEAALRSPDAVKALGPAKELLKETSAEGDVRAFLRTKRSAETRALAESFLKSLNAPTMKILTSVAAETKLSAEDVFMDYLTYDGLYDLALMRYAHKRLKAGKYEGPAKALAESFFSVSTEQPSAKLGIKLVASDAKSVELQVFGAKVKQEIKTSAVVGNGARGRFGKVTWTSNYEQLRQGIRAGAAKDELVEELELANGSFRVDYAPELDEYLTWGGVGPWAVVLYNTSADELADLYAGAAAAGGLEASVGPVEQDPAKLLDTGVIGEAGKGVEVKVLSATTAPALGTLKSRRGQFAVVTVKVTSALAKELKAPAEWFSLANGSTDYPELGNARPDLAATATKLGGAGAKLLDLPWTAIAPKKAVTLALVYDVPVAMKLAGLRVGAGELSLKVVLP